MSRSKYKKGDLITAKINDDDYSAVILQHNQYGFSVEIMEDKKPYNKGDVVICDLYNIKR